MENNLKGSRRLQNRSGEVKKTSPSRKKFLFKEIRTIFSVLLISVPTHTCTEDHQNLPTDEEITIQVQNNGFYRINHSTGTTSLQLTDVTISNESDSLVAFWLFTCDYQSNFVLSDTNYSVLLPDCDANYPELIVLEAKKNLKLPLLIKKENSVTKWQGFKIGFVRIGESQFHFPSDFLRILEDFKMKGKQVIWSDSLSLVPALNNSFQEVLCDK
jgi:hypothetical protein